MKYNDLSEDVKRELAKTIVRKLLKQIDNTEIKGNTFTYKQDCYSRLNYDK
jgi:hypothetical protein